MNAMQEDLSPGPTVNRGAWVVATWPRTVACSAIFVAGSVVTANAYVTLARGGRTLSSFAWPLLLLAIAVAVLTRAILLAEEARLARELRTARMGTPVIRALIARRRSPLPILGRLYSTELGVGAVLLADGDRPGASAAVSGASPFMQGGRLDQLRSVVAADVERASGTAAGLDRCVRQLRGMSRLGNREADLYRIHVLAKAILAQGNAETAMDLASELEAAEDEEERMYATWLRVWFDLDEVTDTEGPRWGPIAEGQARLAALVARAQGAERLVDKLEERLLAIARPEPRE